MLQQKLTEAFYKHKFHKKIKMVNTLISDNYNINGCYSILQK